MLHSVSEGAASALHPFHDAVQRHDWELQGCRSTQGQVMLMSPIAGIECFAGLTAPLTARPSTVGLCI